MDPINKGDLYKKPTMMIINTEKSGAELSDSPHWRRCQSGEALPPLARFEGPGTEASRGATEDQLPCAVEDTRAHMVAQKMATCVKLSLAADDTGAEVTALNQTTCVTKQDKPKTKRDNDELIKVLQLNMTKVT